jgi:hypothetical protein
MEISFSADLVKPMQNRDSGVLGMPTRSSLYRQHHASVRPNFPANRELTGKFFQNSPI